MKKLLGLALLGALAVSCGMKTPETSKLFEKWVDPESGIVSYVLKPGILDYNQQSVYFVNKSMSNDGRFVVFTTCADEFGDDFHGKEYAVVDFKKDKAYKLDLPFYMIMSDIPDGRLFYIHDDVVYCRDLNKDPMKDIKICDLPDNYKQNGKTGWYCCHLTLNHDRTKMFFDSTFPGDKFIEGVLDISTGEWEEWYQSPYIVDHGQFNPVRDDICLAAYEMQYTDTAGVVHTIYEILDSTGVYPRLQLFQKGSKETVKALHNYATHERWNEQGDGFYYCTDFSVEYCDLESREMWEVCPIGVHAMMSTDKRYVVADERRGYYYRGSPWRVFFWDNEKKDGIYICTIMRGVADPEKPSCLHPDPHPQFVKNDEYIIWSLMGDDRRINLAITPVANVKEKLEKKWLGELPENCEPMTVAKRLMDQFLSTEPEAYAPAGYDGKHPIGNGDYVHYSVVSAWVNALQIAHREGLESYQTALTEKFLPFMGEKADKRSINSHVDYSIFGALPLEVYLSTGKPIEKALRTRDDSIYQLGMKYVETEWDTILDNSPGAAGDNGNPTTEESEAYFDKGYSPQTRLWIDDMYMINLLQTSGFRATGCYKYIERAAREMALYLAKLQREDGLFEHSAESHFVWGRGDGWMAAGMPIILRYLPKNNEYYTTIEDGYRKMMKTLLGYQRENGLWGQIVDDPESWDETSCSAMFAYGMLEGIKQGWLSEKTYGPAVKKAWITLCGMLDENANLPGVCIGTGAVNDRDHYLNRPRVNGDPHGQAPMLWLCNALL